jgi:hypothetical protein
VTRYSTQIDAVKEQDEVFEYLATFSNAAEWDPGVVSGDSLTPGPAAVGSIYRLGVRVAGRTVPFDYEVVAIDRPRRVVLQARHGRFVSTDTISVQWAGPGSMVRYVAVLEAGGLFRVLSPVLARLFSGMADRAAAGLRAVLT